VNRVGRCELSSPPGCCRPAVAAWDQFDEPLAFHRTKDHGDRRPTDAGERVSNVACPEYG